MNKVSTRERRNYTCLSGVFLLLFTCILYAGCSKKATGLIDKDQPDKPGETTKLPDISTYKAGPTVEMGFNGQLHLPYLGVGTADYLQLVAQGNATVTYKMAVEKADDKGATLKVPSNFIGGMFALFFYKGGQAISLGTTFVQVVDKTAVPQVPGQTLYGRVIDSSGNPISGVSVSDGVFVTTTDGLGQYYLSSLKKNGSVFISVPGGYKVAVNRTIPQFFQRLEGSSAVYEQRNFILAAEDNERHRLVVFTDTHLANRTDDVSQFDNGFKADLKKEILQAQSEGVKLYALSLGDLTWDEYWYTNSYNLSNYFKQLENLDIPIYNMPGNHDNDPQVADDFLSEKGWRDHIGPTYYSFNIGKIHYIQMDNTLFINTGAAKGTTGSLNYTQGFTPDQLKWLEADLKNVPAGSTVIMGNHIQYTNRYRVSNGTLSWTYSMPAEYRTRVESLLSPYQVQILSGHTHVNYTNFINDKMVEHNIGAVCATWWWTGKYTNNKTHMGRDGAPGGYKVFEIGAGSPNNVTSYYQSIGKNSTYQFRAYDLNQSLISREKYCANIKDNFATVSNQFFSQYANGYDIPRNDNKVLINVFSWNNKWQLKVREVDTGKDLTVTQVDAYDPLHTIHFNMNRMNTNSTAMTFPTVLTSHMFEVTCSGPNNTLEIVATDNFSKRYVETMTRPRDLYEMSISAQW